MRLDFSNLWQLQTLFYSLAVGIILCLIYDIIRYFYRIVKPNNLVVFFVDLFYCFLAAIVTFCFFMLFSKGTIRLYPYFGFLGGFFICRLTLSRLLMLLLDWIYSFISKIYKWVSVPLQKFMLKVEKISKKLLKFCYKTKNKLKNANIFKKTPKKL